jgi:cytidine deaminase
VTPDLRDRLYAASVDARARAYAPYSRFLVGAAILTEEGTIVPGSNVEISSYSLTCCAERVAVFAAVSSGVRRITAVAVATDASPPAGPCGACRQVLYDFGGPDLEVLLTNTTGRESARRRASVHSSRMLSVLRISSVRAAEAPEDHRRDRERRRLRLAPAPSPTFGLAIATTPRI